MGNKAYIASQIDEESELYQRFENYVDDKGHENKSAAVRELVNSALEQEKRSDIEKLSEDPERPPGLLGGLLYDAEQLKHTSLLIAAVLVAVSGLVTAPFLPGIVDGVFLTIAALYALTAFFGFAAPILRRLKPIAQPSADGREVEA